MSVQQLLFEIILTSLKYRKIMLKGIAINDSSEMITIGLNKNNCTGVLNKESYILLTSGIWILF